VKHALAGFFFLAFVFFAPTIFASPTRVCQTCKKRTIGEAIRQAQPGDEILIAKGVYYEKGLIIDKALTLRGEEGAVIDGSGKGDKTILRVEANKVTIENIIFRNVTKNHVKDLAALKVHKARNFEILNSTFENVFFGIMIEKSKKGRIEGNRVSSKAISQGNSGNGIHVWHSSKIDIRKNEVWGVRDGIYLEFVKKSKIIDNKSHHNLRYGLHFMFSNHDEYIGNEFYKNGAGVAVMFSKFILMRKNYFHDNWGSASYGLLLKEIYDADIEYNVFERNTIAINTEGSTRINARNNRFLANGWALKVAGACYKNIYTKNDFIRNSFDLSYNSKLNDNLFLGNYWGSYTGYDLDRDGVGDVDHRPVKLFSYIVNKTPESIVLLRSLFVDIINFSEKVSPVFTPDEIVDSKPAMRENNAKL